MMASVRQPLRTIVYVDGFNFYYGAVRGTTWKWLDPAVLFPHVLGPQNSLVDLHFGHFLRHEVSMENTNPPPKSVKVWKNEEKGSDVNLALHLLNDAWLNAYDCAVVVSNDSDLAESIRLVKAQHGN
jgi:hypothetical protein